ncbi:glutamate-gated kainate-type ion channel receptor subunit GluR5, partial [Trifolium medium]|nr:glutamate-gated kainate-type ion channel receptor subunit GluR5 [Trifolium medium]
DSVTVDDADTLIWHSHVPLKISILAWRLLRDRLPTKTNLVTRGILSQEAHFCVSGCGEWFLLLYAITLFSLLLQLVEVEFADLFCNSFGLPAFGLFGRKEIIDCFEAQQVLLIKCWTRSSFSLIGG